MTSTKTFFCFFGIIISLTMCRVQNNTATTEPQPIVKIENSPLQNITEADVETIKRYLKGNPRWDFRTERGKTYAVKRKTIGKETFLENNDNLHNRVIISFGNIVGHQNFDNITFTNENDTIQKLTIWNDTYSPHAFTSYFIVKTKLINIEILEIEENTERIYTQNVLDEINTEIRTVLENSHLISTNGTIPFEKYYPVNFDSIFFKVENDTEQGEYLLTAAYNFSEEGEVYVKAFENQTNYRLSERTVTPATTRQVGWAIDGKTFFYYQTSIAIYEGTWVDSYEARFELWFKRKNGSERLLLTTTSQVEAWKRSLHGN